LPCGAHVRSNRGLSLYLTDFIHTGGIILTAVLCLFLGACASTESTESPHSPAIEPHVLAQPFNRPGEASFDDPVKPTFATYNPTASTVFPDYRLNVGDVLEVIYHVRTGVTAESYRLKVQDVVSINFPFQSSYDQDVTVQSDGTIRLLLVGEIRVVTRKEVGIGEYHYRESSQDRSWLRFNPSTEEWEPYPFKLVRSMDGGWSKIDPATGAETRLEVDFPLDETGRVSKSLIVDAIGLIFRWMKPDGSLNH